MGQMDVLPWAVAGGTFEQARSAISNAVRATDWSEVVGAGSCATLKVL